VHVTVQVAPAAHDTLPLAPSVTSHALPTQLMLHESPQVPLHDASSGHDSVQLSPAHAESPIAHDAPGSHTHELPLHVGGGVSMPQPASASRVLRAAIVSEGSRMSRQGSAGAGPHGVMSSTSSTARRGAGWWTGSLG